MSENHIWGNLQNEITREEHDGTNNAKRVNVVAGGAGDGSILDGVTTSIKASVISTASGSALITYPLSGPTIYAVVNTGAAGVQNSMVTLNAGPNFIGLVTVGNTVSTTFSGNVTLDAGSRTGIVGNLTLSDPKGFIGLVTVVGSLSPAAGNVTLDDGSLTGIVGNVTLANSQNYIGLVTATPALAWPDPKTYIGLVTITGSLSPAAGNVTLDDGSLTGIVGNVTLSDAKTYIGLVTATSIQGTTPWSSSIVGNLTLSNANGFIGLVSVSGFANPLPVTSSGNVTLDDGSLTGIVGNVTLSDAKTYIGLVTVTQASSARTITGNVTLDDGSLTGIVGNVTLSNPNTYIGLTTTTLGLGDRYIGLVTATSVGLQTLAPSPSFIGLVTVWHGSNVTLNASAAFIGLVTNVQDYGSNVTVHTGIYSASGNNTVFVAPASNRFWLTNLHISSLGRAELEIRSGATTLLPFTALATTGGYIHNFGNPGFPSRAQADALVINLNGGATVGIAASWYAKP